MAHLHWKDVGTPSENISAVDTRKFAFVKCRRQLVSCSVGQFIEIQQCFSVTCRVHLCSLFFDLRSCPMRGKRANRFAAYIALCAAPSVGGLFEHSFNRLLWMCSIYHAWQIYRNLACIGLFSLVWLKIHDPATAECGYLDFPTVTSCVSVYLFVQLYRFVDPTNKTVGLSKYVKVGDQNHPKRISLLETSARESYHWRQEPTVCYPDRRSVKWMAIRVWS